MRTRLLAGAFAATAVLSFAPQASASHHLDCAGPLVPVCTVINRTVFCHGVPPCR